MQHSSAMRVANIHHCRSRRAISAFAGTRHFVRFVLSDAFFFLTMPYVEIECQLLEIYDHISENTIHNHRIHKGKPNLWHTQKLSLITIHSCASLRDGKNSWYGLQ